MLQCHLIQAPQEQWSLLKKWLYPEAQWIVNDLETKFSLQKEIAKILSVEPESSTKPILMMGEPVLRASELWQKLLHKMDPEWQVLSSHWAQYLMEKWLREILNEHSLKISPQDFRRAYQTMGQILPLLTHDFGEEALVEWFVENPQAFKRWGEWYQLSAKLWQKFQEQKKIPQEWVKGVLVNLDLQVSTYKHLVFHLGFDVDDVEIELIQSLSRIIPVDVIIPHHEKALESYQALLAQSQVIEHTGSYQEQMQVYKKMPTMLSEVKDAVAQVRLWLDQGIVPEEIAIISPEIELYWPTLSEALLVEGVPVDKDITAPLSQFEELPLWLSRLRLALNDARSVDGESVLFNDQVEPFMDYGVFQSQFQNLLDVSDYEKDPNIKQVLPEPLSPNEEYRFSDFIRWSFQTVDRSSWSALENLFSQFDEIHWSEDSLTLQKWLDFFEVFLARQEKVIEPRQSKGIHVLSVSGGLGRRLKKVILIGLHETALKESVSTTLNWGDVQSIKTLFGFSLPHADRMRMVDRLQWLTLAETEEILFICSEAHFSGQYQAPSLFWLKGALSKNQHRNVSSPRSNRWDEIAHFSSFGELDHLIESQQKILNHIRFDRGELKRPPVPFTYKRLSASAIEEFTKCPFRFFASRILKLNQDPTLDLDMDPRSRGSLMHGALERLVKDKKWLATDDELVALLEEAKHQNQVPVYNDLIWDFIKLEHIKKLRFFIKNEMIWNAEHTNLMESHTEVELKGFIRVNDSVEYSKQEGIPFLGYIDRIDVGVHGEITIIDYKSSSSNLKQPDSWIQNSLLQLLFYTWLIEEGAWRDGHHKVVSAAYFPFDFMKREYGFFLKDADPLFSKNGKMTEEKKEKLLHDFKNVLMQLIQQLNAGEVQTHPQKESLCEDCNWSRLCRHSTLNS